MAELRVQRLARWTCAAIVGLSLLVGASALAEPDEPPPPTRAEAEAVLDDVVRFARAGDYTGLCESELAAGGVCRQLVDSARQSGWSPGPDRPEVVGMSTPKSGVVLHLRGVRADGTPFTSDFEVSRHPRGLHASTPVYWSGVQLAG
ncbi:hypothetical protein ACQPZF_05295 [Actinosynnema sp. CS-041913]|uniref:hypothetical protein n=1 Tax=Actinosynnema sp. CS-041913 TaxID=3239917 RepID=UPI003D939DCC